MKDPYEGLTPQGYITTGVRLDRIPAAFQPVIEAAIKEVELLDGQYRSGLEALYIYGSVATGSAVIPHSDVDLLSIDIAPAAASRISEHLSTMFSNICRGVDIAPSSSEDFEGNSDEAYGGRIFLRHYCLNLWGREVATSSAPYPGDANAARAFNGDIALHYKRWLTKIGDMAPAELGRKVARKSLLALAGLISVQDRTWSTDRLSSASRWIELNPDCKVACDKLVTWSDGTAVASQDEISDILAPGGLIHRIVDDFRSSIGLWRERNDSDA